MPSPEDTTNPAYQRLTNGKYSCQRCLDYGLVGGLPLWDGKPLERYNFCDCYYGDLLRRNTVTASYVDSERQGEINRRRAESLDWLKAYPEAEDWTFETYHRIRGHDKRLLMQARTYLTRLKPGLGWGMFGTTGAGKTGLSLVLFKALVAESTSWVKRSIFTYQRDMLQAWIDAVQNDNFSTVFNRYVNAAILVIDEIGKDKLTDWKLEQLMALLDKRYNNPEAITCFTSNLGLDELEKYLDAPRFSRLTAPKRCYLMQTEGDDLRQEVM